MGGMRCIFSCTWFGKFPLKAVSNTTCKIDMANGHGNAEFHFGCCHGLLHVSLASEMEKRRKEADAERERQDAEQRAQEQKERCEGAKSQFFVHRVLGKYALLVHIWLSEEGLYEWWNSDARSCQPLMLH